MDHDATAIERAFELARSGNYKSVVEIRRTLRAEGYALDQLTGRTLMGQLRKLIDEAKK